MKTITLLVWGLLVFTLRSAEPDHPGESPRLWSAAQLREYSRKQKILEENSPNIYELTTGMWGKAGPFSDAQITVALHKNKTTFESYWEPEKPRTAGRPADAIPAAEATDQLDRFQRTQLDVSSLLTYTGPDPANPKRKITRKVASLAEALTRRFGPQPWYTYRELRTVEGTGVAPDKLGEAWPADSKYGQLIAASTKREHSPLEDFHTPLVRASWRDVLPTEDPSQVRGIAGDTAPSEAKDLVGATFSYNRNGKDNTDTWTAVGSLILPWQHNFEHSGGLIPDTLALAPSVSLNKVDTNGKPDKESDTTEFRVGAYASYSGFDFDHGYGVELRAAGVKATNWSGNADVNAFEFDAEPRWNFTPFPIGYRKIVLTKAPKAKDESDDALLDYTLRVWLHVEGGDIDEPAASWNQREGSFLRFGPVAQLQVRLARLIFSRDIVWTTLGSYLHATDGTRAEETFLRSTLSYSLLQDGIEGHRIKVNADYQRGGMNLTKEEVDTFTIGLGILY